MDAWAAVVGIGLLLVACAGSSARAAEPTPHGAGEAIYMRGVLSSGIPLEGTRSEGAPRARGADIACVNCHQRSGLGEIEGRVSIPPVAGRYLFHSGTDRSDDGSLPYVSSVHANRIAYTPATLARAIREGVDPQGRPLGYLMPRFDIGDADMAALTEYLAALDPRHVPGVTDSVLHFATIITPDADPAKRRGMLDVLQHYFEDKNALQFRQNPHFQPSGKTMYSKSMYAVNRRWQLHVWELTGPAAGWSAQLQRHLADEPVFAVISGVGGSNWAPVHEFCEREALPCLFPNVEVPVESDSDFYPVYLSRGVLLEAELMADSLAQATGGQRVRSVEQVYRSGDSGEAAAHALAARLKEHGIAVHDHVLPARRTDGDVRAAVSATAKVDALALWLRPSDLASLGDAGAASSSVFMSGLMGGLEGAPLPAAWRERTRMTYPFDRADRRVVRVDYALGWFSIRHIPLVAEQVQVDTYLSCGLLAETVHDLGDSFSRPYLVEKLQSMIEHRILTGYYPHLSLATGERFASKGGYLAHFDGPAGSRLAVEGDWIVP